MYNNVDQFVYLSSAPVSKCIMYRKEFSRMSNREYLAYHNGISLPLIRRGTMWGRGSMDILIRSLNK